MLEGVGIELIDESLDLRQPIFIDEIRLVQQDNVRELDLLGEEIRDGARVVLRCSLIKASQIFSDFQVTQKFWLHQPR